MAEIKYEDVPSPERWRKDSSAFGAIRSKDIILAQIDRYVDQFAVAKNQPGGAGKVLLSDMFQACNAWISGYVRGSANMLKDRHPAVQALFSVTTLKLADALGVSMTRNGEDLSPLQRQMMVGNKMRDGLGIQITQAGLTTDITCGRGSNINSARLKEFRISFKGGLAYQNTWWAAKVERMPAESENTADETRTLGNIASSKGFAPFVVTLDRNFYMALHRVGTDYGHDGLFHSSYNNGAPLLMAGTIRIESGVITGLRMDSGHYQPTLERLRALAGALDMYQVDMKKISVFTYDGHQLMRTSTGDFIDANTVKQISNPPSVRPATMQDFADLGSLGWEKFLAAMARGGRQHANYLGDVDHAKQQIPAMKKRLEDKKAALAARHP
jgi:hypothetical protein